MLHGVLVCYGANVQRRQHLPDLVYYYNVTTGVFTFETPATALPSVQTEIYGDRSQKRADRSKC